MSVPSRLLHTGFVAAIALVALTACAGGGGSASRSDDADAASTPSVASTATVSTAVTASPADCAVVQKAMTSVDGMDEPTALMSAAQTDPSVAFRMVGDLGTALDGAATEVDADGALATLTRAAADAYAAYGAALDAAAADPTQSDSSALLQAAQDSSNAVLEISKLCVSAQ